MSERGHSNPRLDDMQILHSSFMILIHMCRTDTLCDNKRVISNPWKQSNRESQNFYFCKVFTHVV